MAKKKPILANKSLLNVMVACYGKRYFKKKVKLIDDGSLKNIQPPYIVVANHASFADVGGLIMMARPNYPNFVISVTQMAKWPKVINQLGVLPKKQFTVDTSLIRDIKHVLSQNRPVVIYPEAKLSVDGRQNPIKPAIAKLVKLLKVPLVTVCFHGSYLHSPRWATDKRFCPMTAQVQLAVSQEDIKSLSVEEIHSRIVANLTYDDYQYQLDNNIHINSKTLTEGLHGILYKCPHCGEEFAMTSKGNTLTCEKCGKVVTQNSLGQLVGGKFDKVTSWYKWQRDCVKEQIQQENFSMTEQFRAEMLVGKNYVDMGDCQITFNNEGISVIGEKVNLFYKKGTFYTLSFNNDFIYLPTEDAVYRFRRLQHVGCTTKFNLAVEEQSSLPN